MEDIALLKRIDFFGGLTAFELTKISKISERVKFNANDEVMKEGGVCDSIYIIKEGALKVVKGGKLLITLDAGSPVGEVSFIDKGPRSATVIAEEDSVLIKIPVDSLNELMSTDKELSCKIYRSIAVTLCQRLRDADDTLLLLSEEGE